jgi:soluble lytic murein transglycosylase-like protein
VGLALTSSGSARMFEPPAGPPDTLRVLHAPIPKPAAIAQTRYLRRLTERESGPDREVADLAERYRITRPLARRIHQAALAEGIDPELAFRLIRVESVFDEDAIGPGGALGLTQLMYGTARDIDPSVRSRREVLDATTNMRIGFTNLRNMIRMFDGDVRLGVIAYNRGEIAVQRALRRGRDPENGYGERVLGPRAHGGRRYKGPGLVPRRNAAAADSLARAATGSD